MNTPDAGMPAIVRALPGALRATVLIIVGIVVTFSAPLHENFTFNRSVFLGSLLVLALVQTAVFLSPKLRPHMSQGGTASIFVDSMAAIFGFVGAVTVDSLTHTVAVWALLSAIVVALTRRFATRTNDAWAQAFLLLGLALAAEATRGDQVMLIGFFGAYAMIAGVFQAIAAADHTNRTTAADEDANRRTADQSADTEAPVDQ